MKKIMFNDRYGLTEPVMSGLKTMTRRIEEDIEFFYCVNNMKGVRVEFDGKDTFNAFTSKGELYAAHKCRYALGEEVAVAQSYMDAGFNEDDVNATDGIRYGSARGWRNKMYVKAELMPVRIRINGIRIERLQSITEVDCMKEGLRCYTDGSGVFKYDLGKGFEMFSWKNMKRDVREAFAVLIDKISGKGTWESNPYVFVYEFEIVEKEGGIDERV